MTAHKLHLAVAAALFASVALAGCNNEPDADVAAPPVADTADDTAMDTDPMAGTQPIAGDDTMAPADDPMLPAEDPMADPLDPAGTTANVETALDVTSITLGTEAGADMELAEAMTSFSPEDPIIVSIETEGAASDAEIEARLVYEDGQAAGEESETVTTTGAETTNITFENAKPWPAGEYTAEVWINGTQADSATFNVR